MFQELGVFGPNLAWTGWWSDNPMKATISQHQLYKRPKADHTIILRILANEYRTYGQEHDACPFIHHVCKSSYIRMCIHIETVLGLMFVCILCTVLLICLIQHCQHVFPARDEENIGRNYLLSLNPKSFAQPQSCMLLCHFNQSAHRPARPEILVMSQHSP